MLRFLLSLCVCGLIPITVKGAIPLQINHQGLVRVNGVPFGGPTGDFRFALVDPDGGPFGIYLWTNDGSTPTPPAEPTNAAVLEVINGIYNVRLGDIALANMVAIPSAVFNDDNVVLRIWFDDTQGKNGVGQLDPDHVLTSAPYAFRVGFVDNPELTDALEADILELGDTNPSVPGSLSIFNGQLPNQQTIRLDGAGNGANGRITLFNSAGNIAILATADAGDGAPEIHLVNDAGIDAVDLDARVGSAVGGLTLRKNVNQATITLRAAHEASEAPEAGGRIIVSRGPVAHGRISIAANWDGANTRPLLDLVNDLGAPTVSLLGGSPADGGRIEISRADSGTTIFLDGATGKVCASEFSTTGGCDVAESFELSDRDSVASGMVMVLDELRPGHLRISDRAYDKKVAGIVSGAGGLQPGVRLGSRIDGTDDLPVALSGRVYCFVHAMEHAVKIGDLLTTSDTPGHAMKVTDFARSQGAVLGKAMEPLESGKKSLILVLVGLQ